MTTPWPPTICGRYRKPLAAVATAVTAVLLLGACGADEPDEPDVPAFKSDYRTALGREPHDWDRLIEIYRDEVCLDDDLTLQLFLTLDSDGDGEPEFAEHRVALTHFCPDRLPLLDEVEAL